MFFSCNLLIIAEIPVSHQNTFTQEFRIVTSKILESDTAYASMRNVESKWALTDDISIAKAVDTVINESGRVYVLVNNAGYGLGFASGNPIR